MRVLVLSKALVNSSYRKKLAELSALGVEVVAAVPPEWKEGGAAQHLEREMDEQYGLIVTQMRLNGHFHLHHYPRFSSIIRTVSPDVVHIDEEAYNFATYHAARAARRAGVPFLFFSWQNMMRQYPPPFSWMEGAVFSWAAGALAGSVDAEGVLRGKGYRGPIWVVPQFGVDPDVYAPGTSRNQHFTVGYFNRLIPGKAPVQMLEAFSALPGETRLLIVGDGPLRAQVQQGIADLGLSARVELRARVPSTEMPALYQSVDVVALPSISTPSWKEQFGRVLIEAMAAGVPVIASDSGEIPRVLGPAGILFPEGDVRSFASALRRLYDDHAERERLGRAGRERVLEHYTHRRIAAATLEAYRAITR